MIIFGVTLAFDNCFLEIKNQDLFFERIYFRRTGTTSEFLFTSFSSIPFPL